MIHVDTKGLLDRCGECGERAGFETLLDISRARCTECCEQTEWARDKYAAMIDGSSNTSREAR